MAARKLLITAGPTREAIDPVRFISNHSSGKMGYALAEASRARGCDTTLISGPVSLEPPPGVRVKSITTTEELRDAVMSEFAECDALIMAAAPADFRPAEAADHKIKKTSDELSLRLIATPDILMEVARIERPGQIAVGFALETDNAVENGRSKLKAKQLDLIVVNSPGPDSGFDSDTNRITVIDRNGKIDEWKLMKKREIADRLLDQILAML